MFQDLLPENVRAMQQKRELVLIDVRSPAEYEEATIPGSLNIPLFNNEERAEIGTIYRQLSPDAAKQRGLEIVSAKLPAFIRSFAEIPGKKAVFCWRGGMRSKTTATLLSLMDIHSYRIAGGYRAYRNWVVETLASYEIQSQAIVLHGYTGCGKTAILHKLKERGYPIVDLEGLAGHRGSIFGQIGLPGYNQKTFDSLLLEELLNLTDSPYMIFEAESKRIGKVVLPEFLIRSKERGRHIWLEVPLEERVKHILDDYQPWNHSEACLKAFSQIKSRIHTPVAAEIHGCLITENYARAVELLLLYYYDPRYAYSSDTYEFADDDLIQANTLEEAADEIERIIPMKIPNL